MFAKIDFFCASCVALGFGVIQVGNDGGQIFPSMTPILGHFSGRVLRLRYLLKAVLSLCPSVTLMSHV